AAVGRGDADAAVRRRRGGDARQDRRHAQDDAGLAAPRERGGARGRGRESSRGSRGRRAHQGQPRGRVRRGQAGGRAGAGAGAAFAAHRGRGHRSRADRGGAGGGRRHRARRQLRAGGRGQGGEADRGARARRGVGRREPRDGARVRGGGARSHLDRRADPFGARGRSVARTLIMDSYERLLALLRAGEFVSGEAIAETLGISRAAVGKRVDNLRRRGFAIAAAPRRGYRLDGEPDALTADVVATRLTTAWLGRAWRHHARVGSTNDEAAAWARAPEPAPHGAVVVADAQDAGRGRLGRKWHSPPGESLYLSVVLRPPLPPHRVPPMTLAAGVAVVEAMVAFDVTPALKWPNDVQLDGKKVAGILTEMSADLDRVHHLVVGTAVARAEFAAALCARLEHWVDTFVADGAAAVVTAWKQHARFFGTRVRVTAGRDRVEGVAEDLDDDGALRLRLDDGSAYRVVSGEVSA